MNYEMNPLLLEDEMNPLLVLDDVNDWVCENLMYQTMIGYDTYGSKVWAGDIKDSGKRGDVRIYQALKDIEKVSKIKL